MLKSSTAVLVLALLTSFSLVASAEAAPPPNDAFAEPTPISVGDEFNSENIEATAQTGEPSPITTTAAECKLVDEALPCASSVWYSFEAPASIQYTVDTCDRGTDFDTGLGVYSGTSIGALTKIGSSDDACAGGYGGNGSAVTFTATAGTVYSIDVVGYRAARGSFYLRLYEGPMQTYLGPDTAIQKEDSYPGEEIQDHGNFPGVGSGPRHTPSFSLIGTAPGSTFECDLDGAGFSTCTSPVSYEGLDDGNSHVFRARATSAVEGLTDPTPLVERFTVDTEPPETTFELLPEAEVPFTALKWRAGSSETNFEGNPFQCGLDDWAVMGCRFETELDDLCEGTHEFRSAAWDYAANVDPTPATSTVKVTAGSPCEVPEIAPVSSGSPTATRSGDLKVEFNDHGAGGVLALNYGTTSSYGLTGESADVGPSSASGEHTFNVEGLLPDTTYHYQYTLTTPFGSAQTPDATFTTTPLESGVSLATVQNGTPRVVGVHAAEIPVKIDGAGLDTEWEVRISREAPTDEESVGLEGEFEVDGSETGPQARSLEVVDLERGTYNYRVVAFQSDPEDTVVLGPEDSFQVPAATPGPKPNSETGPPTKPAFKLKSKNVKVGKLKRSSKKLTITLSGLPAKSKAQVNLKAGSSKQTATKKADAKGKAKLKVTLSKRIRKALKEAKVKKASLKVTVTPPGEKPSSVLLKLKLNP